MDVPPAGSAGNKNEPMKNVVIILSFMFCTVLSAQTIHKNDLLPQTTNIRKGVLENGMTYYIAKSTLVKNVASYYIIQNVGSVLENDDQQGLAHFLEHMAFNGTKHFEGKGILNTLQEKGLVFGRDINAYTSFDETVYNIDNMPTTPDMIDTGLLILKDWADDLLLTNEEIDAERGVIKEEWRTRQNGSMRILQQQLPTMFNSTIYASRLPIGKMEVIDHFEYRALRDFYQDWYRTDLQAIAVVGDVNLDGMEAKIKDRFSDIPPIKHPKQRINTQIPDNEALLYAMALDEEVSTAQMTFGIRQPKRLREETVADLKTDLLNAMVTTMLSARLKEISQKPEAPFLGARVGFGDHTRTTKSFTCQIYPKPNEQQEAYKKALAEVYRAVKFGFTPEELDRTINQFETSYETAISKKDEQSHRQLIQTIKNNYLEHGAMTDVEREYEVVKSIFKGLRAEDVHWAISNLYTQNNRYLLVTGVKDQNNLTKEEAGAILMEIGNDGTLAPYTDGFAGKTLLSDNSITPGEISSEYMSQKPNATTFTLSNGIKVHYKFSNKNKNDVRFKAVSYGGLSLVKDDDLPSASMVKNTVDFSGLGDYSATDLTKVLAGKSASTAIYISDITEGINGNSTTKDVETLLQMVHLRFVEPRFDEAAFKVLMGNVDNYIMRKSKDINAKISDSVTVALYGHDNPQRRLFDQDYAKEIDFETIKKLYKERFANPADFQFFIVGDVPIDSIRPLLKSYIASLPTEKGKEQWTDNTPAWVRKHIDKDVFLEMEDPKSTVRIGYKNNLDYSLKNEWLVRTLGDLLQLRYTETLREEEGGTYGASANAHLQKEPTEQASISVTFDANPEKVEGLVKIVHNEIHKLAEGDIDQSDLDKTLTNYLKEREEAKDNNSEYMRLLTDYVLEGYNRHDPKKFEDIINGISKKDIQEIAKTILKGADTYEIICKPDQALKK